MYNYILFDWDGCLAQTLNTWIRVCSEALALHGIEASDEEVWRGIASGGVAAYLKVPRRQAFRDDVTSLLLQQQTAQLYDGVQEFLQRYHAGKKLAIVSNTRTQVLRQTVQHHGLAPYFRAIIDDASATEPKPSPEGIHQAMALLEAVPEQTLMIGDSWSDIVAAQNAGIDSALFYPSAHRHLYELEQLRAYQPSHVIHDFSELSMLVA